jgi:carbonic anhydrase
MTSALDDLLANNAIAAADHRELAARPSAAMAVVTCMDARISDRALGIARGQAHVMRTAGARITEDVLRSLVFSTRIFGTREILVVGHTDCGLSAGEERLRAQLRDADAPPVADLHAFDDVHATVRDDVAALVDGGLLPDGSVVHGLVYDVATGRLEHLTTRSAVAVEAGRHASR